MTNSSLRILFFGKKGNHYCEEASYYLKRQFPNSEVYLASKVSKFPDKYKNWSGDFIISYLTPFIIPEKLLRNTKIAALNLHPGPPEYPGIGCTNFALYNAEVDYGVTCHHMEPKVDSGSIIFVDRFGVNPNDDVYSLTQRSYSALQNIFIEF